MIVDVSNNFMITSTSTSLADKMQARAGRFSQVCPVKRYRTVEYTNPNAPVGGNTFTIYKEVIPIITRALRKGMHEIDYTSASIATTSRIMREMRRSRNPRIPLAPFGAPDLSDISDATEPDSYAIKPPVIKAESRSPRKRIAKLTSSMKGGFKRLTQIVKLSPGSSPKAEPSPSKSESTPSTPLRLSPTPLEPLIIPFDITPCFSTSGDLSTPSRPSLTPSAVAPFMTTPHQALATPSRPIITPCGVTPSIASSPLSQSESVAAEDSPSRLSFSFRGPSSNEFVSLDDSRSAPADSNAVDVTPQSASDRLSSPNTPRWLEPPSNGDQTLIASDFESPERIAAQSPIKFTRPVAPTPSRAHRREFDSPASVPSTPCESDSPIGLAALIPPSTPVPSQCPYESQAPADADFQFGTTSPAFNTISWMNPAIQASDSHRIKNVNTGRRRQSEPLLRKYLATQARRKSSSPRKVTFEENDSLFQNTSISSIFQSRLNVTEAVDPSKTPVSTSNVTADPTPTAEQENHDDTSTRATHRDSFAPTLEDGVLNIDMRQNLDIFHASPVAQLAGMARDSCSGHAKVVVNEQNGRLFVRFKLSAEHAHMFPASQGFDESIGFAPLAASHSPRINFDCQQPAFNPDASTPVPTPSNRNLMETPTNQLQASSQRTPSMLQASSSLSLLNHTLTICHVEQSTTPNPTPIAQVSNVSQEATSSSMPENITPAANTISLEEVPVQQTLIQADETIFATEEQSVTHTPTPATESNQPPMNITPVPAQNFTTSFTPVNKASPQPVTTPSGEDPTYRATSAKEATENSVPTVAISHQVYDDSPGRDYMRDFIKRSRRTSTTEAGSPIAPPSKRKPLEAKSPNTPSPQKKRKLQKDEAKSPLGKMAEDNQAPAPKRVRRTNKTSRRKPEQAKEMADDAASVVEAPAPETTKAEEQEEEEAHGDAPVTRRSTRLRSTRASSGPKSSIPTPIKLGRSGAGRGTMLNSTVRSDQQELTAQTRMNTKKNKGNAEYPAQVLARVAEAAKVEESDASDSSDHSSGSGRKSVVWKDPLEDVQVEEKPKKGRAAAKAKATQGKTGIAKPSQKKAAKVAESLGMVSNGTPARPKRMTRSQTRSQP